jgi:hypothetical protein
MRNGYVFVSQVVFCFFFISAYFFGWVAYGLFSQPVINWAECLAGFLAIVFSIGSLFYAYLVILHG